MNVFFIVFLLKKKAFSSLSKRLKWYGTNEL